MQQDKAEFLKYKLKSVTKLKLIKQGPNMHYVTQNVHTLSEELRAIKAETELMELQLQDLKSEISKMQSQIAMIGICEMSEKSKIQNHISNLEHHKNCFDNLFFKENEALELNKREVKKKEEELQELKRQEKLAKEEKNQLQLQEIMAIEQECDVIEQECAVLKKRNKAIILKLRRKLIESEDLMRELMKKTEGLS